MSIPTALVLFGVGCVIIHHNSPAVQERRQRKFQESMEKMMELRKEIDKRIFIMKFIDEIPELSYYEAVQLKSKLGNIYLEWNDE
jgi:hypothetical protein